MRLVKINEAKAASIYYAVWKGGSAHYGASRRIIDEFLASHALVSEVVEDQEYIIPGAYRRTADKLKHFIAKNDLRDRVQVTCKSGHIYLVRVRK